MKSAEHAELLVVDDNEMNRDMLSRRLTRAGYQVTIAEDGYQALNLVRDHQFDLVVLDVTMPGMSGFEVLQIIREKNEITALPVIMATAHDGSDDVVAGLKLGANDYVTKPIDYPALLARIHTQLQLRSLAQLKDEFLQIASHDLKNPLGNVLLSAYLVLESVKPGQTMTEDVYEMVGFIVQHSQEMKRIITDFLDFQAMKDGNLKLNVEPANLNDIASRVAEDNSSYAQSKNIGVGLAFDDQLPQIEVDPARIAQVLQNFVGNAIKFCAEGSTVLLRTMVEADCARVEVVDSGPGLSEADLAKVFIKYARLSNKPTGSETSSGLGLAICKQMIEAHGGSIGARSNPDRGATFWFSLPRVPAHSPAN